MRYDRASQNLDHHPNYILAAFMASARSARPSTGLRWTGRPALDGSPPQRAPAAAIRVDQDVRDFWRKRAGYSSQRLAAVGSSWWRRWTGSRLPTSRSGLTAATIALARIERRATQPPQPARPFGTEPPLTCLRRACGGGRRTRTCCTRPDRWGSAGWRGPRWRGSGPSGRA
jgi:hypothetical protein